MDQPEDNQIEQKKEEDVEELHGHDVTGGIHQVQGGGKGM